MRGLILAIVTGVTAFMVSAVPSGAAVITVSSNPLWTDTGLSISATDTVTIGGASGTWSWATSLPEATTNAGGTDISSSYPDWVTDEWITNGFHGQLIGYIGADPDPNLLPRFTAQNSPDLFVIGTGTVVLTGKHGFLWLGMNDDYFSYNIGDNSGSVTANVDVAPVPEPGTMMLLGSGLVGLAGWGRKRFKK